MADPIIVDSEPTRPLRRSYSQEFKINLVTQCQRGDRSLSQVAMDNQINANLLRRWQREFAAGASSNKLLPVKVGNTPPVPDPLGYLEININANTVKVVGSVDSHYLSQLVRSLR